MFFNVMGWDNKRYKFHFSFGDNDILAATLKKLPDNTRADITDNSKGVTFWYLMKEDSEASRIIIPMHLVYSIMVESIDDENRKST